MLLPIGRDQVALRRLPIVTLGILVLCTLVHVLVPQPSGEARAAAQRAFDRAIEYYIDNPDLRLPPLAEQGFDLLLTETDGATRSQIHNRMAGPQPPPPNMTLADRQAKLEEALEPWESAAHKTPPWIFGLIPAHLEVTRLLTHLFVHVGFLHLLFTLWFLYLAGALVEDVWGRPLYVLFYLAVGVVAGLGAAVQLPTLDAPLLGASGAVAGVMGAFLVRFPRSRIQFQSLLPALRFSVPTWLCLGLWAGGEYFGSHSVRFAVIGTLSVAYWTRVWGFGLGVVVAVAIRLLRLEDRFIREAIAIREEGKSDSVLSEVQRLLERGQPEAAAQRLAETIRREPGNVDAADTYWHLTSIGQVTPLSAICLRIIHNDLLRKDELTAAERWRELTELVPTVAPEIYMGEALARALIRHADRAAAWAMVERGWKSLDPSTPANSVVGWARLAYAVGSPIAKAALGRAIADPRVTETDKRVLRDALQTLGA